VKTAKVFSTDRSSSAYGAGAREMDSALLKALAGPLATIVMLCVTMLSEPSHTSINDFMRSAASAIDSFSRSLMKGSRLLAGASAIRWTSPCIISGFVSSLATLSCRSIGPHGLRIAGLMDSETVRDILTFFFRWVGLTAN